MTVEAVLPVLRRKVQREPWMGKAACRGSDPAQWIPERGNHVEAVAALKRVCAACPVQSECLAYGMSLGPHEPGIYGGLSGKERRLVRRRARDRAYRDRLAADA